MGDGIMSEKQNKKWKNLFFLVCSFFIANLSYAAGVKDNEPLGRTALPIVDGQYPASYFPNTEILGDEEMRITALGTGMPNATKAAASLAYLVELGNGDKFLFDIGSGSMANMFSLRPDFSKLDKVFASHLHTDHVGDFMALHIGSWLSGRYSPLHNLWTEWRNA
jgi:ribonuclease Z